MEFLDFMDHVHDYNEHYSTLDIIPWKIQDKIFHSTKIIINVLLPLFPMFGYTR